MSTNPKPCKGKATKRDRDSTNVTPEEVTKLADAFIKGRGIGKALTAISNAIARPKRNEDKVDLNVFLDDGNTLMHLAVCAEEFDQGFVEKLSKLGASLNTQHRDTSETPLDAAVKLERHDAVLWLKGEKANTSVELSAPYQYAAPSQTVPGDRSTESALGSQALSENTPSTVGAYATIGSLKHHLNAIEEEVSRNKKVEDRLQGELHSLREQLRSAERELSSLRLDSETIGKEREKERVATAKLQLALEKTKNQFNGIKEKLKENQDKQKALQQQLQTDNKKFDAASRKLEAQAREAGVLKSKLETAETDAVQSAQTITVLETEAQLAKQSIAKLLETEQEKQARLDQLREDHQNELCAREKALKDANKDRCDLLERMQALEKQLQTYKTTLDEANQKLEAQSGEADDLRSKLEAAETNAEESAAEVQKAKVIIVKLHEEKFRDDQQKQEDVARLEKELKTVCTERKKEQATISKLQSDLDKTKNQLKDAKKELKDNKDQKKEIQTLEASLDAANQTTHQLEEDVNRRESEIKALIREHETALCKREETIEEASGRISTLDEQLAGSRKTEKDQLQTITNLKEEVDSMGKNHCMLLNQMQTTQKNLEDQVKAANDSKEKLMAEKQEKEAELDALKTELVRLKESAKTNSPDHSSSRHHSFTQQSQVAANDNSLLDPNMITPPGEAVQIPALTPATAPSKAQLCTLALRTLVKPFDNGVSYVVRKSATHLLHLQTYFYQVSLSGFFPAGCNIPKEALLQALHAVSSHLSEECLPVITCHREGDPVIALFSDLQHAQGFAATYHNCYVSTSGSTQSVPTKPTIILQPSFQATGIPPVQVTGCTLVPIEDRLLKKISRPSL